MKDEHRTERAKLEEEVAGLIGEGVHAALRKLCDSPESWAAYKAIQAMPDEEWGNCTTMAAEMVISYLQEEGKLSD